MNEKLKALLEAASRDPAFGERINAAPTQEALIAVAREKGIELAEEDLSPLAAAAGGELSDDELDAVAGGKACYCVVGGGGTGDDEDNKTCACITGGVGMTYLGNRCFCAVGGFGVDDEDRFMEKNLFGLE